MLIRTLPEGKDHVLPWPCFCCGSKSESELDSELELESDGLEGADCCRKEDKNSCYYCY